MKELLERQSALSALAAAQEAAVRGATLDCPFEQAMSAMDGDDSGKRAALRIFESLGAAAVQ